METVETIRSLTPLPIPKTVLKISSAIAWIVLIVVSLYLLDRYRARQHGVVGSIKFVDSTAIVALFASLAYMFGFFGMQYL